jgi:subtilase family serine protease
LNDIAGFHTKYPYLAYNVTVINIDGTPTCPKGETAPCPDGESTLDTEWSTAMSNSYGAATDTAHGYLYVAANSLYSTYADMYNHMLNDNLARVFSTSWDCVEFSGCNQGGMDTQHAITAVREKMNRVTVKH